MKTAKALCENQVLSRAHGLWPTPGNSSVFFTMPVFPLLDIKFNLSDVAPGEFVPVAAFMPHLLTDTWPTNANSMPAWRLNRPTETLFPMFGQIAARQDVAWIRETHPLMQVILSLNQYAFNEIGNNVPQPMGYPTSELHKERIKESFIKVIDELMEEFKMQLTNACEQIYSQEEGRIKTMWSLASHASEFMGFSDRRYDNAILDHFLEVGLSDYHKWKNYDWQVASSGMNVIKHYSHAGLLLEIANHPMHVDGIAAIGVGDPVSPSGPNFALLTNQTITPQGWIGNFCRPSVKTELGFKPNIAYMVKKEKIFDFVADLFLGVEKTSLAKDDMVLYVDAKYGKIIDDRAAVGIKLPIKHVTIATPAAFMSALVGFTKERKVALTPKDYPKIEQIVEMAQVIAKDKKNIETLGSSSYYQLGTDRVRSREFKVSKLNASKTFDLVS